MSYYATSESNGEISSSSLAEEKEEEQNLMKVKSEFPQHTAGSLEIVPPMQRPILICRTSYSRRTLGLFSAFMCGMWGGSCLVPMHYANGDTGGLGYVISFSIGALGERLQINHFYDQFYVLISAVDSCDRVVLVLPFWASTVAA